MPIASGLFKQVAYKIETTFGTAPGQASGQQLRRVQSTLDLNKDTYQSNELRPDLQVADYRHGVRRVAGKISGELSCKTYADFFAAAFKRDFTAGASTAGAGITIAGTGPYTLTRAAGSYLTDGFKVGDVIRLSVGTFNAANINKNLLITGLTATVATVIVLNASAMVAEGPVTGATVAVAGKKTFVPTSGHTDKSVAVEHWYSDLVQSELFLGNKIDKVSVALPPTGMATVDFDLMGQDLADTATKRGGVATTAQYYTTPTTVTTTGTLASVNGVVRVGGVAVATITGMSLEIDPTFSGDPVVGSNTVPNLFPGRVVVTGQFTAYFDGPTMRDAFVNESEIDLVAAFTADNTAAADFIAFVVPRLKLGGAAKNDGENGLVQTFPFQALLNVNGGTGVATEKTTISIQDAQA